MRIPALVVLLALAAPLASAQQDVLERLEGLSQRLDGPDPAEVAQALALLRAEHGALSARFQAGEKLSLEETRALCSAARRLVDQPPSDLPAGRDSLNLLTEALAAEQAHYDPFGTAMAECWIAEEFLWQGRMQEARQLLDGALERYQSEDLAREALMHIHATLADLERLRGAWSKSAASLQSARTLLAELGLDEWDQRPAEALLDAIEAQLYLDLGLPDQAAPYIARLRAVADELGDESLRVSALVLESNLGLSTNDDSGVVEAIEAALAKSRLLGEGTPRRAQLQLRLAQGLENLERLGKRESGGARAAFAAALSHPMLPDVEALTAELGLARLALLEEDLSEASAQLARARQRIENEPAGGRRKPVLEAALLAALEARLASARNVEPAELERCLERLESSYELFLEQWADVPLRKGGVGFLAFTGRRVLLCELVRVLLETRGPEAGARAALEHVLEAQSLGSLARWIDAGARSLDEVERTLVRRGTGYLVFLPGPYDSFVFELDSLGARCTRMPAYHAWEEVHLEWAAALRRIPRGGVQAAADPRVLELGRVLSAELFPPGVIERARKLDQVGIVGWDLLFGLPLEALPAKDEQGRESLLGLELALFYLPSLPVGCVLAERAEGRRDGEWLVLAAPMLSTTLQTRWPELTQLSWSRARTQTLEGLYPKTRVLTLNDASFSALAGAGSACLLHIVTHGVYDTAEELPAAFVLSPGNGHDGVVTGADLEALELPPIVSLSVCGAARGPIRGGDDGISHLGGALLRGGSSAVILSRQEIEQEAALDLMELAHAGILAQGETPARALLEARRALHARNPAAFYDALVHLVGLGDIQLEVSNAPAAESVAKGNSKPLALLAGTALAITLLAVLLRRRRPGS